MGYLESVKNDVATWIEDEMDLEHDIMSGEFNSVEDIAEYLNDILWVEDSVTGNASGSYFFNRQEAREAVLNDMDTISEALAGFDTPEEIGKRFLDADWEYMDVTARCYVLGSAIAAALEDHEDIINALFEKAAEQEAEEA